MDLPVIERHRTAIGRAGLSRPMRLALEHGVLDAGMTVMDYGCGRGDDVARLSANGFEVAAWDPHYRPEGARVESDVVNLGYVLNVIESPAERSEVLRLAWALARRVLVVAAQVWIHDQARHKVPFGDGIITGRNTFQRYFDQDELAELIKGVIGEEPVPAGLGIFYVFRDPGEAMRFRVGFLRRRFALVEPERAPRLPREERVRAPRAPREDPRLPLLAPILAFMEAHGREPEGDELTEAGAIAEAFGSLGRAVGRVRRAISEEAWARYQSERRDDLLVYLALAQFKGRPKFGALPADMQRDVRTLLGSYPKACEQADALLFSLRDYAQVRAVAAKSAVGKRLPDALYVHPAGLADLHVLLRLVEGCARAFVGEVEDANLIKLHLIRPAVGYLSYPDFDADPHPALTRAVDVDLAARSVRVTDYSARANPPILHRRELFVPEGYPGRAGMAEITRREEDIGLYLNGTSEIGTRDGWKATIARHGVVEVPLGQSDPGCESIPSKSE